MARSISAVTRASIRSELAGRYALPPGEYLDVPVERIVLLGPALDLAGGDVGLIVVLRVTLAAVGHQLDQRHSLAPAGPVHRLPGDLVGGDHIVAVGPDARDAVADRLVLEAASRRSAWLVGVE